MQCFLEYVVNCILCIIYGVIKWNWRNFVIGEFRVVQNKVYLWVIIVGQYQVLFGFNYINDMLHAFYYCNILIGNIIVLFVLNECIVVNCDDSQWFNYDGFFL